jgi:ubiquinone/menaquinone biosynthesis C-methylase UbiE
MKVSLHGSYANFIATQQKVIENKLSRFDIEAGRQFVNFLLQVIPPQEIEEEGLPIDINEADLIRKLWDNQSAFWAQVESFPNYFSTMSIFSSWLKKVQNPTNVLSIGCGLGFYELFLQHSFFSGTNFVCTDISGGMIQEAQKFQVIIDAHFDKKSKAQFKTAKAEKLPFGNKTMDAVMSSKVLQWSSNQKQFLSEMIRVLKPKGLCLITFSETKLSVVVDGESGVSGNAPLNRNSVGAYFVRLGCTVLDYSEIHFPQGFGQSGGIIKDFALLVRKK